MMPPFFLVGWRIDRDVWMRTRPAFRRQNGHSRAPRVVGLECELDYCPLPVPKIVHGIGERGAPRQARVHGRADELAMCLIALCDA